jgi:hypothetical protein
LIDPDAGMFAVRRQWPGSETVREFGERSVSDPRSADWLVGVAGSIACVEGC